MMSVEPKPPIHIREQELRRIIECFDKMAIEMNQMYELFNQELVISTAPLREILEQLKDTLDGVEEMSNEAELTNPKE